MAQLQEQLKWIKAQNGFIPAGAVVGGKDADGKELYIARVFSHGTIKGIQPGKAAPHLKCASIPFGNKEVCCENYEVLLGKNPRWKTVNKAHKQPGEMTRTLHVPYFQHARDETLSWDDAIKIGEDAHGQPLYCAKVNYQGTTQVGKAGPHLTDAHGYFVAHFTCDNQELTSPEFDLLIGLDTDISPMKWLLVRDLESMKPEDWAQCLAGGWEADSRPLYICRAHLSHTGEPTDELAKRDNEKHGDIDGTHPGKAGPHLHGAHVAFQEKEVIAKSGFEILLMKGSSATAETSHQRAVHPRIASHMLHRPPVHLTKELDVESIKKKIQGEYSWQEGCNGSIPQGALRVGKDNNGNRLYIARFMLENGSMQVGKVGTHLGCAHVSYGGGVKTSTQYEVLCWTL